MARPSTQDSFGGWLHPIGAGPIYYAPDDETGTVVTDAPPAPGTDAPAAPPAADTTTPPAPDAPAGDAPPPWEGKTVEELWKLNTDLKDENVRYKERFRPWEEAAGDLHEDDQRFYREFLGAVRTGDQARLAELTPQMRKALDALTPAQQEALADAADAAAGDGADDLDPLDPSFTTKLQDKINRTAEQMLDARDQKRTQEQAVQKALDDMNAHLRLLADDPDVAIPEIGDPTSEDYAHVLWIAKNNPKVSGIGDPMERLTAAAKAYRETLDRRAQALLEAKVAADAGTALPTNGEPPSGRKQPANLRDAKASAAERLDRIALGTTAAGT